MRRYSPPYYSPPRRGYGGRARSPLRRGYGRSKEQNNGSLLVRNIPLDCRPEELRVPFERFGLVRDVYIPRDYHTGEPRGFAFVQFVDPYEAAEAQYHMNRAIFAGREITVVVAAETRKRPEEMRRRSSVRGTSGYGGRQSRYDLGLVQYLIRVPPITLLVLVVVIVRGPILLLPGVELTTPFPQIEGKRTMQDHQENPLKGETVTVVGGHTLQVMRMMVMKSKMVMRMARKLHMTPMKHEGPGSLHLDEHHDHLLDLDLGLLICQPSR